MRNSPINENEACDLCYTRPSETFQFRGKTTTRAVQQYSRKTYDSDKYYIALCDECAKKLLQLLLGKMDLEFSKKILTKLNAVAAKRRSRSSSDRFRWKMPWPEMDDA
jgi:hypothetical protein